MAGTVAKDVLKIAPGGRILLLEDAWSLEPPEDGGFQATFPRDSSQQQQLRLRGPGTSGVPWAGL